MREKEVKLIITFHTAAEAMAAEKTCKRLGIPGRLIPIPQSISAGCGLAWSTELCERGVVEEMLEKEEILSDGLHECML